MAGQGRDESAMRSLTNAGGGGTADRGDPGTAASVRGSGRAGNGRAGSGQAWEPAVHSAQLMFQPLRPLSGVMVLSGEFLTMTTSPTRELL